MTLSLAKCRFNFRGQTAWQKKRLKGECLHHFRLILEEAEALSFDDVSTVAASQPPQKSLNNIFTLTAARLSARRTKTNFAIYSDRIAVRFVSAEADHEIDIIEITIGSGPSGGGGQTLMHPTSPTPHDINFCRARGAGGTNWRLLTDRVAACMATPARVPISKFISALALRTQRVLLAVSRYLLSVLMSVFADSIIAATTNKLSQIKIMKNKSSINKRNHVGRTVNSIEQLKETLVQSAPIEGPEDFLSKLDLTYNGLQCVWAKDLCQTILKEPVRANIERITSNNYKFTLFFFGSGCATAKDRKTIAIGAVSNNGRAKIYVHSPAQTLKQRNSVDLILAAAISQLRKQTVSNITIECDGHTPFNEGGDENTRRMLTVWRRVFRTRQVVSSDQNYPTGSGVHVEFILNNDAQETITDYYGLACARFESGMNRNDVYVWRELAHLIRHNKRWSQMSIVLRNLTKVT